jgi:hypothetical protein
MLPLFIAAFFNFLNGQAIVNLISPNGGEVLLWDSTHTIIWEFSPSANRPFNCDLYLSVDGGKTFLDTIATGIGDTLYHWTVPQVTSSMCRVLIQVNSSTGNIGCEDASDSNFSIIAPGIEEDHESDQRVIRITSTCYHNFLKTMNTMIKPLRNLLWIGFKENPLILLNEYTIL